MPDLIILNADAATPIRLIAADELDSWLTQQPEHVQTWARASGFSARPGEILNLPGKTGALEGVALGFDPTRTWPPFPLAALSQTLPAGDYVLDGSLRGVDPTWLTLGWLMGGYRFDRYRSDPEPRPAARLVAPAGADVKEAGHIAEALFLIRDLINTPACDMGPEDLEAASRQWADKWNAEITVIKGEDLLAHDFPLIHMVGRASSTPPRLIDITMGRPDAPKVTLVGKGVCFDSGGLNIKTGTYMDLMKKDMGGAAHALGLAHMLVSAGLDLRLRLLIPAVENAISGDAFRPGDITRSRQGLMVEIGNTDAEGRLILADALTCADEEQPELLIDLATLTGAARAALGPDLAAFYCDDDALAADISAHSQAVADPLWRLPLWAGYEDWLKSEIADLCHISSTPMAGSVTAALFLKRFVTRAAAWIHFDLYGWTTKARPGQPVGGEGQAVRALYAFLKSRFG